MSTRQVGVVGAGTMGVGIAQVALESGDAVIVHDVDPAALDRAATRIRAGLERRASSLGIDPVAIDGWVDIRLGRLRTEASLDALASTADLVVEAVVEELGVKQDIVRRLDDAAPPGAILATNTSALSVTAIASASGRPERVLGLHFFNPVPRMELVEVVVPAATAPEVVDRAEAVMTAWGKRAVRCSDTPGFIVNRVNRPFTIQALRMVEAGQATPQLIDETMRAAGYPMGPFELMDLVGLDVNLAAARSVWEGLGRPDRLRPSPIQERLMAEGRLGRKRGEGFYRYDDGRAVGPGDVLLSATAVARLDGDPLPPAVIRERIERAIADEAHRAVDEGIATPDDIALALRAGAGHPRSPFSS